MKRTARNIEKESEAEECDRLYQSAFSILLSQRLASSQIDLERVKSDFESAVHPSDVTALSVEGARSEHKTVEKHRVNVENIEDESWERSHALETSNKHPLVHTNEELKEAAPPATKHPTQNSSRNMPLFMEEVEDEFWAEYRAMPKSSSHILTDALEEETILSERNIYNSETV